MELPTSMPSLKDFVAALQAGWFPALAVLIGCGVVIAGDFYQIPYLENIPDWLVTVAVVVGVFAFSILAANLAYAPVVLWRKIQRGLAQRERVSSLRREVLAAPPEEAWILAYLTTTGRKAFTAEFNDGHLAPLVSKGLVIRLGGTNNILKWPYIVQSDVWQFLLENKSQFHLPDAENMGDPFNWRDEWRI